MKINFSRLSLWASLFFLSFIPFDQMLANDCQTWMGGNDDAALIEENKNENLDDDASAAQVLVLGLNAGRSEN